MKNVLKNVVKSKIFVGAVIAVAAVAAIIIVAVNAGNSGNDLQSQLDLGEKYVSELDYENAIIAYEKALEIDPYCLDAYLGLADVYSALGQMDKAIEIMEQAKNMLPDSVEVYENLAVFYAAQNQIDLVISTLEEGIRVTGSDRLKELLREYQTDETQTTAVVSSVEGNDDAAEQAEEAEASVADEQENEVVIETQQQVLQPEEIPTLTLTQTSEESVEIPIIVPLVSFVDTDSFDDYGSYSDDASENSGSQDNVSGDTSEPETASSVSSVTQGIIGNVYGTDGQGISGVTVTIYSESGGDSIMATTDTIGYYTQSLSAGTYRIVLSKEGYADLDATTVVWDNTCTNSNYIMLTSAQRQQTATVQGVVISAVDSQRVEGVTVTLLNGFDAYDSQNISNSDKYATTESDGTFSINDDLYADYYTVAASKDGYSTYLHNETIKPGENELTINISPLIQTQGEYRIVLTWGATPRDLDSHLISTGTDNYHVFYGNKTSSDGSASLDVDDVTSYGPETITVTIGEGNTYTYAVHNFTDQNASYGEERALNLSQSDARVVVYSNDGIIFDGSVPVNVEGTTWEVFRIENGQFLVMNSVSFDYPTALAESSSGKAMLLSDEDDDEIILTAYSLDMTEADNEVQEAEDEEVNVETEEAEKTEETVETEEATETEEPAEREEVTESEGSEVTEEVTEAEGSEVTEEVTESEEPAVTEEVTEAEEPAETEEVTEAEGSEVTEEVTEAEEPAGTEEAADTKELVETVEVIETEEPVETEENNSEEPDEEDGIV